MGDVERIGGRIVLLNEGKVRIDRDLDRIREDVCVAMISRLRLLTPPRSQACPAVSASARVRRLARRDGGRPRRRTRPVDGLVACQQHSMRAVPLEELFIELVGGER